MRRPFDSDSTWDGEAAEPAPPPAPAARYTLGEPIGAGGLADVFAAWDHLLRREVAIKRLRHPDPGATARFRREAEVAAALDHPGVAPVYDLDEDAEGRPFLAMKRVVGRSLGALHTEAPGEDALLEVFGRVCDTVAFAHARGVLHRDLKAENILVGAFGEVLVMDWGLAWRLGEPPAAGVAGTPACMAPEQARGEALDERADVYGLGAVLYALLTGRSPREGPVDRVLDEARRGLVRPPRELAPGLPRELEAILLKALAPDPAQRYPSASALREDVDAFRQRRPLVHLSSSWGERARKWAWRHRGPVRVAAAALVLGIVLLLAGLGRYSADVGRARDRAMAEAERARATEREATFGQARANIALADALLARGQRVEAAARLEEAGALLQDLAPDDPVLTLARSLHAVESPPPVARCRPHGDGRALALDLSTDGLSAWSLGQDGRLVRWDTADCAELQAQAIRGTLRVAAVSARAGRAVVALAEGTVVVDADGVERARLDALAVRVGFDGETPWAFTTEGRLFTLGDPVQELSVPAGAGQTGPGAAGALRVADSTPSGSELGGVWDAAGRGLVVVHGVNAVALEPDGQHVLHAATEDVTRVRVRDGQVLWTRTHAPTVRMGLSSEGDRLWVLGFDGTVTVHRVADGELLGVGTGATQRSPVALSAGGRVLAVGTEAGEVRVYLLPRSTGHRPAPGTICQGLGLSPDGAELAVSCEEGVRRYDRRTGVLLQSWERLPAGNRELAWSPDGAQLAVAARDEGIMLLGPGERAERLATPTRTVSVAWLPDGAVVTVDVEGTLHRREPEGGPLRPIARVLEGASWSVSPAGPGRVLVAAHIRQPPALRVVDARTGAVLLDLPIEHPVFHHAVSPDGRRVAAGTDQGEIWLYADGALLRRLPADGGPTMAVAFSPDGRWLASTGYGEQVRLWDAQTGEELRSVRQHHGPGLNLAFTPDGAALWSSGGDGLAVLPLRAHLEHAAAVAGLRSAGPAREQGLITLGWWERALALEQAGVALSAELQTLTHRALGLTPG